MERKRVERRWQIKGPVYTAAIGWNLFDGLRQIAPFPNARFCRPAADYDVSLRPSKCYNTCDALELHANLENPLYRELTLCRLIIARSSFLCLPLLGFLFLLRFNRFRGADRCNAYDDQYHNFTHDHNNIHVYNHNLNYDDDENNYSSHNNDIVINKFQ